MAAANAPTNAQAAAASAAAAAAGSHDTQPPLSPHPQPFVVPPLAGQPTIAAELARIAATSASSTTNAVNDRLPIVGDVVRSEVNRAYSLKHILGEGGKWEKG